MKSLKTTKTKNPCTHFIFAVLLLAWSVSFAQESTWTIDPAHSAIHFDISYFKVGTINGGFDRYAGAFTEDKDGLKTVEITIETASINTHQKDRDTHLRSTDFLSAEKYPEIRFKSTAITPKGSNTYVITGDFTMAGITKSITLNAEDKGSFIHPRFKTTNKFMTVSGSINRDDFKVGANYPPAKMALGSEVQLVSEIQLIAKKSE